MGRERQTMGLALRTSRLAMQRCGLSKASYQFKAPQVPSKPPGNDPVVPARSNAVGIHGSPPAKANSRRPAPSQAPGSVGNAAANTPPGSVGGIPSGKSSSSSGLGVSSNYNRVSGVVPKPAGSVGGVATKTPPGAVDGNSGGAAGSAMGPGGGNSSSNTGGAGASTSPGNNHWRLHPSLPVDVRLLGVGLVTAGMVYLYSQGAFGDNPFGPGQTDGYNRAGAVDAIDGKGRNSLDDITEEPSAAIIREQHDSATEQFSEDFLSADGANTGTGAAVNDSTSFSERDSPGQVPVEDGVKDSARSESATDGSSWLAAAKDAGHQSIDQLQKTSSSATDAVTREPTLKQPSSVPPGNTAQVQTDDSGVNVRDGGASRGHSVSSGAADHTPVDASALSDFFNSALSPNSNSGLGHRAESSAPGQGEEAVGMAEGHDVVQQAKGAATAAVASARQAADDAFESIGSSMAGTSIGSHRDGSSSSRDGADGSSQKERGTAHNGVTDEQRQGAEDLHDRGLGMAGLEMPFMGDSQPMPSRSATTVPLPEVQDGAGGAAISDATQHDRASGHAHHDSRNGSSGGRGDSGSSGSGSSASSGASTEGSSSSRGIDEPGRVRGVMGLQNDLTPRELVAVAMERDEGEDDLAWVHYQARRQQARSDARTFEQALKSAQAFHQGEMQRREEHIKSATHTVQQLREKLQQQEDDRMQGDALLRRQAKQQLAKELQRQETQIKAATEEATNEERRVRHRELDSLRVQLGAVKQAFSARSDEATLSHQAHKVALSVLALQNALQQGRPFQAELESLALGGQDEPIVRAALASLPQQLADSGLPTGRELSKRFNEVSRSVAQLSYLPPNSVGLLSLAACKLAATLKIEDVDSHGGSPLGSGAAEGRTSSEALSAARSALSRGDLSSAAQLLEQSATGSAAAPVAADWVAMARARASADQTLRLLQAHATAMTSSLT